MSARKIRALVCAGTIEQIDLTEGAVLGVAVLQDSSVDLASGSLSVGGKPEGGMS